MKKNLLYKQISMNQINDSLLQESFKEFIIMSLTDDQLEEYGKNYGDWFNRRYDEIKNKNEDVLTEYVLKNIILIEQINNTGI